MNKELAKRLLVLPEVEHKKVIEKRGVERPDLTKLTAQQKVAFDNIIEQCIKGDYPYHLVEGYAGTGKTYLTAMLIEYLLTEMPDLKIAMTAPTNKAVKVANRACPIDDHRVTFVTQHKILAMVPKKKGKKMVFVQEYKKNAAVEDYDIVIIDELSMSPDQLFILMDQYTSNNFGNVKIILIGDPAQTPPVNKEDCIPFQEEGRAEYNIGRSMLTDITRQAEGSSIITTSMKIRNFLSRPTVLPVVKDDYNEETLEGVYALTPADNAEFVALLSAYFTSDNFQADPDFCKVVAWTNKCVDGYNAVIRKLIYGAGIPKVCVGERMITDEPVMENLEGKTSIIMDTSEEFKVLSFEVKEHTFAGELFKYYQTVVSLDTDINANHITLRILHEDSHKLYDEMMKLLSETASEKHGFEAKQLWDQYWELKECFAAVKYNYAITVHKSQGSSYKYVFVVEKNIDRNSKVTERNRLKYTAFTRPVERLFIVRP